MPNDLPPESRARFEAEVLPHLDVLYRMAHSLCRDDDQAADLVQDSVLRALRAFPRLEHHDNLRSWLARIVHSTFLDRLRYEKRRPLASSDPLEDELDLTDVSEAGWTPAIVRDGFDDRIEAALRALPDEWRVLVHLVDVEEFAYEEAAEALALPIGTVRSRLHRARARLYQQLADSASARAGFESTREEESR